MRIGCEGFNFFDGGCLGSAKMLELGFGVEHLFLVVLLETLVGDIHFSVKSRSSCSCSAVASLKELI